MLLCLVMLPLAGQEHIKIDSVNSSYDEQNPVLSPDGNTLYFTRSGHPENVGGLIDKGDIWYSQRKPDGGWSTPVHGGNVINHPGLNGVVGFSADGKNIYLLNYFDPDGAGGGNLRNGISRATWKNGAWADPYRLRIQYFANNSEYLSASITPDEQTMILAMRSFQTYGNEDLYVSFKQEDGTWSQPQNLGNTVNTFSEEWSPYLSADKTTLYFSSNGHGGEGSRDVFVSKRQENSWTIWSKPTNLGAAVNTKGVELGYFIPKEGDMAFFSTTQNSEGFGDIFNFPLSREEKAIQEFELPEPEVETNPTEEEQPEAQPVIPEPTMVVMTMQVLDVRTYQPVDAEVTLTFGDQEALVDTEELDSKDKKFIMSFEQGTHVYVSIVAEGYLNYKEEFFAEATALVNDPEFDNVEGFLLTPNSVGTKIRIENVLFEQSKATFSDPTAAQINLDKLVALMEANPDMSIRLEGHTDSRGNPKLLKKLSQDRVQAVKDYITKKGIAPKRINTVGYGGENPIARNTNESGRQENRRVEFVIIK